MPDQVDGAKPPDTVFEDVKAIFAKLKAEVTIHVSSFECLV